MAAPPIAASPLGTIGSNCSRHNRGPKPRAKQPRPTAPQAVGEEGASEDSTRCAAINTPETVSDLRTGAYTQLTAKKICQTAAELAALKRRHFPPTTAMP